MSTKRTTTDKLLRVAVLGTGTYAAACRYLFEKVFCVEHSYLKEHFGESGETDRLDDLPVQDVYMDSYDGLKLHAMVIRQHPESGKWLVPVHGYGADGRALAGIIRDADAAGFNLLVPDQRAHGLSEGKYTGLGWPEHYDLIGWISRLSTEYPEAEIALYGISLGASTVMNAVGERLPQQVKCAVEDCGFADIREIIEENLKVILPVSPGFLMPGLDFFIKQILHFSMYDVSTRRQLRQTGIPVLFIHGEKDTLVPVRNVYDSYYACAGKREIRTAADAGHAEAYRNEECRKELYSFINKYLSAD